MQLCILMDHLDMRERLSAKSRRMRVISTSDHDKVILFRRHGAHLQWEVGGLLNRSRERNRLPERHGQRSSRFSLSR